MEKQTEPKVKVLASGTGLVAKQMRGEAGEYLPKHLADLESILYMIEGECILSINGEERSLKQGDTFVIPPHTIHQINALTDFKAVHFMPKHIRFQF